ncbi:hypothetical protein NDU88_003093 [Pleurodeles waltl]|uniref:Uncharacterized protein n=1 Tax=Pleurodeles waltl TaxID=8319 RepID=A0AAV7SF46_PLEWA|nr:hypothetical protein NDU88_003093 [Pleurodeles waltl]
MGAPRLDQCRQWGPKTAMELCPDVCLELSKCSTGRHHRLSGSHAIAAALCLVPAALLVIAAVAASCWVGRGIKVPGAKRQGARRLSPSVPAAEAVPSDGRSPPSGRRLGPVRISRLSRALGAASPLHQLVCPVLVRAPRVHAEQLPKRRRAAPRPGAVPDQAAPTHTWPSSSSGSPRFPNQIDGRR